MNMSFYEDKTAEILSKIDNVKCSIISTAIYKNQKKIIHKKINNISYFSLPNKYPEIFESNFSKCIHYFIKDNSNNILIFNQFYKINSDLQKYKKAKFFYSIHCPFSQNYSGKSNFFLKILQNIKNSLMLIKKYFRELQTIYQIQERTKSSIIYSSLFVKNYYTKSFLFFFFKKTLKNKSIFIPLCINNKKRNNFKFKIIKKKLRGHKLKISFLGRVTESKGIDHILNLCKILKNNRNFIFFIGGSTEKTYKNRLLNLKKKYNLSNLLLNLNGIPNEKIRSLYSLFDISLHFSNVDEGTSYSIMESMISKCIPISNYSEEMIKKKYGFVFNVLRYDQIIKLFNTLHKNKKDLLDIKQKSSNHIAKKYNQNILIKKYKLLLSV